MLLPFPRGREYVANGRFGFPAKRFVSLLRVCPNLLDISFAATDNRIRQFDTGGRFELADEGQHAQTGTGTEVEEDRLKQLGTIGEVWNLVRELEEEAE